MKVKSERHVCLAVGGGWDGVGSGGTHLIDCWARFVRERWTECERKSKVAVGLALSWRKSPQSGTGSSRPGGGGQQQQEGGD